MKNNNRAKGATMMKWAMLVFLVVGPPVWAEEPAKGDGIAWEKDMEKLVSVLKEEGGKKRYAYVEFTVDDEDWSQKFRSETLTDQKVKDEISKRMPNSLIDAFDDITEGMRTRSNK